jgi:glucoamylase
VWRTGEHRNIEVWKLNRQVQTVPAGTLLRIQASAPFLLHWTGDEWQHSTDTRSQPTALDIDFVDIGVTQQLQAPVRFTFLWLEENRWEGKDYEVEVHASKVEIEQSNDMRRKSEAHGKRTSTVA